MKNFLKQAIKPFVPYGVVALRQRKLKAVPKRELYFEIHITEHCNLNCRGCSHFSPIAKEVFLDPDAFDRDMARLSQVSGKRLAYIKLLGGEPLLHPDCGKIMDIARKHFDGATNILLLTNGLLLTKQSERFWKAAARNNVWIAITHYPIRLDLDAIKKLSIQHGVPCGWFVGASGIIDFAEDPGGGKTMYKFPLDLNGRQNGAKSFARCGKANSCFTLRDGRLYTCSTLSHIKHFKDFFGKNLPVLEEDSIDIYKARSVEEILAFLAKPVPFCRFCKTGAVTFGHQWGASQKNIAEWT